MLVPKRWLCALALSLAVLHGGSAVAQSAVGADVLFDEGRKLMREKRWDDAARAFEQSNSLDPSAGTLLNLAECYVKLDRTASAWSTYRAAAGLAATSRQRERERFAQRKADELEPKLATLSIVVPGAVRVAGLTVQRNGSPVPDALWGQPVPVDAGTLHVEVTAPGKQPWAGQVIVDRPAQHAEITVPALIDTAPTVPAAPSASATTPDPPIASVAPTPPPATPTAATPSAPPRDVVSDGSTQRMAGWIVGGVGIVAAGVGTFLYLQSQATLADSNCPKQICDESKGGDGALNEQGRSQEKRSFVVLGLGGALLATGLVLVVTAPGAQRSALELRVAPTTGGAAFGLRGNF